MERIERLNVELFQLFNQLTTLGIPVPNSFEPTDPEQQVNLIGYLTTLGSFAERGNLADAKYMPEFNIQVEGF